MDRSVGHARTPIIAVESVYKPHQGSYRGFSDKPGAIPVYHEFISVKYLDDLIVITGKVCIPIRVSAVTRLQAIPITVVADG